MPSALYAPTPFRRRRRSKDFDRTIARFCPNEPPSLTRWVQGSPGGNGKVSPTDSHVNWSQSLKVPRVLMVDGMTLVRQGIQRLLRDQSSIEIVGEAAGADDAADLVRRTHPDVVLLAQDMPDLETSEIIPLLKRERQDVEVIVLSDAIDEERAFEALRAGASGYILKDIFPDALVQAIHGVCSGRAIVDPYVTRQVLNRFRTLMQERARFLEPRRFADLTERELTIVAEMANGATDREIARTLRVAESTVKSHVRTILRKIGARNRTQAVAVMLRRGVARTAEGGWPWGSGGA